MILDEEAYQIFTFGRYTAPLPLPLSKGQQKVLNMANAHFTKKFIAKRMKITTDAVNQYIALIRKRGHQIEVKTG